MFPEALPLSIMDLLDARLEQAWRLIDQLPVGEQWTAYVPSLGRQIYRWLSLEAESDPQEPNSVTALPANTGLGADALANLDTIDFGATGSSTCLHGGTTSAKRRTSSYFRRV
jgi:hypothetical protein